VVLQNEKGLYNPEDDDFSIWNGFASQQRTLVRIEAGYLNESLGSNGIWTQTEFPTPGFDLYDTALYGSGIYGDESVTPDVFIGLISGDLPVSDKQEITLSVRPLNQVFVDFPARNLTGFTTTGFSASNFMELVRDQTDGAGAFIFRPFFGDTITNWNISATTVNYDDLTTSTAQEVFDKSVWQVMEKLSEAENFITYIDRTGKFNFKAATTTASTVFAFKGAGNREQTIKKISRFGPVVSKYYSRVEIKHLEPNTFTSTEVREATFEVNGANNPWNLGHRTFKIENVLISDSATAQTLATQIFNDVATLRKEIQFDSTFVPHLNILDRITVSYDAAQAVTESLWDINAWDTELTWDQQQANALVLDNKEFKMLSYKLNLDNFSTSIIGREL
jgi:hypothetical protein